MIKVVSFDLDGTLVKSTFADKVWLEGLPILYSKEKNISVKQAKQYIYELYEKVGESRKEWYDIDWWFKRFDLNQSWKSLLDNYKHHIKLYCDTIKTLDKLTKKFELIILSNAKKEFIDIQLDETNIKPYFKYVFSSISDFNFVKKTPDVYKNVLSLLNIKSNEIIHIGDNIEFDYKSPKRIGINSIYLDRKKNKKADHIIFSLNEIDKLISNL